jgi:hypothetical protein
MLRRVAVLCLMILLCPAAGKAQKKRAAAMNFDYAAVTIGGVQLLSGAQQPHDQPDKNAAPPEPGRAEMRTARQQMMPLGKLGVGINGIDGAPQTLQLSQAAGGLDSAERILERAEWQVEIPQEALDR